VSAAFSTKSRVWSIPIRASAIPLEHHGLLGQGLAKGDPRVEAAANLFERYFCLTDRAHTVMDPPRTKPALRNLETAALAEQDVRNRNHDVLEQNFSLSVGRIVVAEYWQGAHDLNPGCIAWDKDHRLLLVAIRITRIGLAHEDEQLATRIERSGGKPFAAIDDKAIPLSLDAALDVGRI
jgi:hypothetical protein